MDGAIIAKSRKEIPNSKSDVAVGRHGTNSNSNGANKFKNENHENLNLKKAHPGKEKKNAENKIRRSSNKMFESVKASKIEKKNQNLRPKEKHEKHAKKPEIAYSNKPKNLLHGKIIRKSDLNGSPLDMLCQLINFINKLLNTNFFR